MYIQNDNIKKMYVINSLYLFNMLYVLSFKGNEAPNMIYTSKQNLKIYFKDIGTITFNIKIFLLFLTDINKIK